MRIDYENIAEEELLKVKDKLSGKDWCWLLIGRPQLSKYCNWNKLSGDDWECLLREQPQLSRRCSWNKLRGYNWCWLLREQPQFMKYCSLKEFSIGEQKDILSAYKEAL